MIIPHFPAIRISNRLSYNWKNIQKFYLRGSPIMALKLILINFIYNPDDKYSINIQNFPIFNSKCEKLLGIKIDNSLSFTEHVADLCSKASQKLHALPRVAQFMRSEQRRVIMKAFINSQFGYCPLDWMFHSRKLNNR